MSAGSMLEFEIQSDPAQLRQVREDIHDWSLAHGWSETDVADIVLAIDEALTNVIRHAYGGKQGERIIVSVREIEPAGIAVLIRDFGKQVPLEQIEGRDLDDLRPGGLGVHIIRSVMDCAEYTHAKGGGMQLLMRKYRKSKRDRGASEERND